jgi:hypothetical protein
MEGKVKQVLQTSCGGHKTIIFTLHKTSTNVAFFLPNLNELQGPTLTTLMLLPPQVLDGHHVGITDDRKQRIQIKGG